MALCKKPFYNFGCGGCLPCLINTRRVWSHRMVLESFKHAHCAFVTLTYDQEHLPESGTLVPKHAKAYVNRLNTYAQRKGLISGSLRYVLVGEYGDETGRPHYHLALYGLGAEHHDFITDNWKMGFAQVGQLTPESAQYIVGYVVKKLTVKCDPRLIYYSEDGRTLYRHPEFKRQSNGGGRAKVKGGIGFLAVGDIANSLRNDYGVDFIVENVGVPNVLSHGSKKLPLGRYLRRKLSDELGLTEVLSDKDAQLARSERMQVMCPPLSPSEKRQKILNMESRNKIFSSRKTI